MAGVVCVAAALGALGAPGALGALARRFRFALPFERLVFVVAVATLLLLLHDSRIIGFTEWNGGRAAAPSIFVGKLCAR